jgi:hypothetical protein
MTSANWASITAESVEGNLVAEAKLRSKVTRKSKRPRGGTKDIMAAARVGRSSAAATMVGTSGGDDRVDDAMTSDGHRRRAEVPASAATATRHNVGDDGGIRNDGSDGGPRGDEGRMRSGGGVKRADNRGGGNNGGGVGKLKGGRRRRRRDEEQPWRRQKKAERYRRQRRRRRSPAAVTARRE